MLNKAGDYSTVNNDNPLVTLCMKAQYFPNGDFLTAKLGANPSYMWRSILVAQEVLKRGCRKRIGDGKQTEIWKGSMCRKWFHDYGNAGTVGRK